MTRATAIVLGFAFAIVAGASAVSAHPGLETGEAAVGAPYKAVVKIPHGCDGSATTKVRVQLPEGLIGAKPMPKPGWTLETVRGPYAKSYPFYHGAQLSEGVREVTWTGKLPDEFYDEFVVTGFLADSLPAGTTVYFPVFQTCEKGSTAWTEIPAAGQDGHKLGSPAPALRLLISGKPATSFKVGAIVVEAPWARATPGGANVGGGYLKITNTGTEADRLVGGSLPNAAGVEVHEMSMADGVMKMRRLDRGLEIKPGESVELKPGGYHLMFMGLTQGLKESEVVKGTLVFEKAGTLQVEYRVVPIGSQPASGHSHH